MTFGAEAPEQELSVISGQRWGAVNIRASQQTILVVV